MRRQRSSIWRRRFSTCLGYRFRGTWMERSSVLRMAMTKRRNPKSRNRMQQSLEPHDDLVEDETIYPSVINNNAVSRRAFLGAVGATALGGCGRGAQRASAQRAAD